MQLNILQGTSPWYRYAYFECGSGKYFADIIDLNEFVHVLIPLPRLLHIEVRIKMCDESWNVIEESQIALFKGILFTDKFLTECVESFIVTQDEAYS